MVDAGLYGRKSGAGFYSYATKIADEATKAGERTV
jgi:3-hydroxyacyl-CoA dehydrogenase